MARIRTAYVEEAGHVLFALQGDGSLTLGEVTAALPEVRDRHLRRFENEIEAISRGHEPPPLREEFDSTSDYLLTSARYTLAGRNSPLAWGQVLLCALAGVLLAIVLSRSLRQLSREVTHLDYRGLGAVLDSVRLPLILVAPAARSPSERDVSSAEAIDIDTDTPTPTPTPTPVPRTGHADAPDEVDAFSLSPERRRRSQPCRSARASGHRVAFSARWMTTPSR